MGAAAALPAVASTVSSTAGASALANLAAGSSLASGVTTGTLLGSGATMASMPALSYAGANLAAPGLLGALPSAVAPTAGIFSQAAPALGGLSSFAPAAAQTISPLATAGTTAGLEAAKAGIIKNAMTQNAMQNAIMQNVAGGQAAQNLAGAAGSQLAGQAGNISNQMYNQLVNQFARPDLGQGLTQLGPKLAGPEAASSLTPQTTQLAENIRAFKTATEGPASMSYAQGAQGIAPNVAPLPPSSPIIKGGNFLSNLGNLISNPSMQGAKDYFEEHPAATLGMGLGAYQLLKPKQKPPEEDLGTIRPYEFRRTQRPEAYAAREPGDTSERLYFDSEFIPLEPYPAASSKAKQIEKVAKGGIAKAYAVGGPVETMAAQNAIGANTGYPQAAINTPMYSNPMIQRPEAVNVLSPSSDAGVGAYSGEPKFASGGISHLGDYSDGGRLLKGPGDGVSDSIPAVIGKRQPARLADGEFVVPARIVSELGNGSTEAGARKLYAMMDRIQKGRRKSVGKGKVAVDSKSDKHLPA